MGGRGSYSYGASKATVEALPSGGKPSGMSKESYDRYKSQGFSDAQISKIWDDTKQRRKAMSFSSSKARSESQVTTTTYEAAQRRMQKNVDGWFGRGMG